eukprot:GDKJ01059622.1.p1 GENE.GDKJ01059622.1~~GDKJ01059622.1.p1  ORF type:complete len:974 (+),score=219.81 GDKJ01059622.1:248-2923(+)
MKKQSSNLEMKISVLEEVREELLSSNRELSSQIANLNSAMTEISKKHQEEYQILMKSKDEQLEDLRASKSTLVNELDVLKSSLQILKSEYNQLEATLESEKENFVKQEQILRDSNLSFERRLKNKDFELQSAFVDVARWKEKTNRFREDLTRLNIEKDLLQVKVNDYIQSNQELHLIVEKYSAAAHLRSIHVAVQTDFASSSKDASAQTDRTSFLVFNQSTQAEYVPHVQSQSSQSEALLYCNQKTQTAEDEDQYQNQRNLVRHSFGCQVDADLKEKISVAIQMDNNNSSDVRILQAANSLERIFSNFRMKCVQETCMRQVFSSERQQRNANKKFKDIEEEVIKQRIFISQLHGELQEAKNQHSECQNVQKQTESDLQAEIRNRKKKMKIDALGVILRAWREVTRRQRESSRRLFACLSSISRQKTISALFSMQLNAIFSRGVAEEHTAQRNLMDSELKVLATRRTCAALCLSNTLRHSQVRSVRATLIRLRTVSANQESMRVKENLLEEERKFQRKNRVRSGAIMMAATLGKIIVEKVQRRVICKLENHSEFETRLQRVIRVFSLVLKEKVKENIGWGFAKLKSDTMICRFSEEMKISMEKNKINQNIIHEQEKSRNEKRLVAASQLGQILLCFFLKRKAVFFFHLKNHLLDTPQKNTSNLSLFIHLLSKVLCDQQRKYKQFALNAISSRKNVFTRKQTASAVLVTTLECFSKKMLHNTFSHLKHLRIESLMILESAQAQQKAKSVIHLVFTLNQILKKRFSSLLQKSSPTILPFSPAPLFLRQPADPNPVHQYSYHNQFLLPLAPPIQTQPNNLPPSINTNSRFSTPRNAPPSYDRNRPTPPARPASPLVEWSAQRTNVYCNELVAARQETKRLMEIVGNVVEKYNIKL